MSSAWEDRFAPDPVPDWLLAFEAAPVPAVDALLGRRFYFGRLNAADPEELLVDWTLLLAGANGFVGKLDEALEMWIERNWGIFPPEMSAEKLADAWSRLANVVTYVEDLPRAARALRQRFDESEDYLGPLTVSPSQDPLGRYRAAITEHQEDQSLAPFWWRLCDLPDGVPFYHAPYAISGLLGLPPLDESQAGGFREQAAYGVVRLAAALYRRVEAQEVNGARARDEWLWTARRAMARLPFPARWREVFEDATQGGLPDECRSWLELVVPGLFKDRERSHGFSKHDFSGSFDVRSWPERAKTIARALRENRLQALEQAKALLREEERYALLHGDSRNLVLSLRNFAKSVWNRDAGLAVRWAETAITWEPWDARSWNTLTQARWKAQGVGAALPVAWEAAERFPEDAVARNGLAEVLREAGRLAEAEVIYRQTAEDFRENTVARNGLAGVLREAGHLDEAEAIYRQTMADFPKDAVARTGLAGVLKESGRLAEAEAVYRQTVEDFPDNAFARTGLAEVLKESGRLAEAEAVYRQAVQNSPGDAVARVGLAAVLRLQGSQYWPEALALVEAALTQPRSRVAALAEKGRLLEAMGRFSEAAEVFETSRAAERTSPASTPDAKARPSEKSPESPTAPMEVMREGRAERTIPSPEATVTSPPPSQTSERAKEYLAAPRLNRGERAARTGEARLLRRWARRGGDPNRRRSPDVLRRQAGDLLDSVLSASPHDPKALAEKGQLLLDSGRLEEARELLCRATDCLPGKPVLLVARARLEREEARTNSVRLSEETMAGVFQASDRLRALGGSFEPLIHLQKGRAVLALQDGQTRRNLAAKELDKLHRWMLPNLEPELDTFEAWWSRRLNEQVFLPLSPDSEVRPDDVDELSGRLDARAAEVDALDEAYGLRKDPRAAPIV